MPIWELYFDGGITPLGYGFGVYRLATKKTPSGEQQVYDGVVQLGMSSEEGARYSGLVGGLECAQRKKIVYVMVHTTDYNMPDLFAKKHGKPSSGSLTALYAKAKKLADAVKAKFKTIKYSENSCVRTLLQETLDNDADMRKKKAEEKAKNRPAPAESDPPEDPDTPEEEEEEDDLDERLFGRRHRAR